MEWGNSRPSKFTNGATGDIRTTQQQRPKLALSGRPALGLVGGGGGGARLRCGESRLDFERIRHAGGQRRVFMHCRPRRRPRDAHGIFNRGVDSVEHAAPTEKGTHISECGRRSGFKEMEGGQSSTDQQANESDGTSGRKWRGPACRRRSSARG